LTLKQLFLIIGIILIIKKGKVVKYIIACAGLLSLNSFASESKKAKPIKIYNQSSQYLCTHFINTNDVPYHHNIPPRSIGDLSMHPKLDPAQDNVVLTWKEHTKKESMNVSDHQKMVVSDALCIRIGKQIIYHSSDYKHRLQAEYSSSSSSSSHEDQ
jgi:hypothetical protein